jgi:hypothetical protein
LLWRYNYDIFFSHRFCLLSSTSFFILGFISGITNYPIGVGINSLGQVTVADNHNNFNITTFSQDGTVVAATESRVKHAQCFDVALMNDGSMILASKDYRIYLYRFQGEPQGQQAYGYKHF